ncbi:MAG: error-prone DNA polymerase, partial [bacterium]
MTSHYAELHALSNFTFLRGASHPDELVTRASKLGYRALAITDECSLAGVVRAHVAAKDSGLPLIIGSEFQSTDSPRMVALAKNREGYAQLSALITLARRRSGKGDYHITRQDFENSLPDCLLLLTPRLEDDAGLIHETCQWLQQHFHQRSWLAVERLLLPGEATHLQRLQAIHRATGIPLVATGDVHMHVRGRRALQDLLTAIRLNIPLARAGYALHPNGERHLRPLNTLARLYQPAWMEETLNIARQCQFSLDELRYEYPEDLVPSGQTASQYLRQLTEHGIHQHWPEGISPALREQIEHELSLISELHYEHFFLTVYDIVRFARQRGILCQGRGSAANSAVCYCLNITAVNPASSNMLFERFISRERNEPPDIDVDFDNGRREEVMQYIYRKYGRHRAALAATLITYRHKSALRDTGKALGLDPEQINRLSNNLVWWDKDIQHEHLRAAGFEPDNPLIQRLLILARDLQGFPRHLSQHVGGFIIARDQLSRLVPIENAAMENRTIIQWDKNDIEALGLLKVDCLALGMLSVISHCFPLLKQFYHQDLDMKRIPTGDRATYRMIQRADTVGVFQIESRAQMNMLPRLKPRNFYDLVIQIAIVRPGPIQGDMVHPYLRRRDGKEAITYPNEEIRAVLQRTLGVPIFQEQVIELAMVAAGFSGGEADQLRRAIGAWRSTAQLATFQHRLVNGMLERGYDQAFAEKIFEQIKGFGEYGFPESHSASFAHLAYVSAWLKCHYPAVFTCALLNSQPMGFYSPSQLVQDAKRHGVHVLPVDVCHSKCQSTLEPKAGQLCLRLGLDRVKNLSQQTAEKIVTQRQQHPFEHLHDLQYRTRLNRKESEALAAADALASLAGNRHQARWQALGNDIQPGLFEVARSTRMQRQR